MELFRVLLWCAVVLRSSLRVAAQVPVKLPCPTTCANTGYFFAQRADLDFYKDPESRYSPAKCASKCFRFGYPYYDIEVGYSCSCHATCNNDPTNGGGFTPSPNVVYGYYPPCVTNVNITCSPVCSSAVTLHSVPGAKYKCCFTNTNSTFPILNYPFYTTNFSPLLTDDRVSSRATALGFVGPGCTFCFSFINPTSLGTPSFFSPSQPLALASLSFSSSAGSGVFLDCNTAPSFSPYGVTALVKFSCILVNVLPRTVRNVVFSCTNFTPLFTSGLNRDCTLSKPVAPNGKVTFVFQVLLADASITLKSYA